MKTTTLILLLTSCIAWANPNELSFYGVVDDSTVFRDGEPITITVIFNPNGVITRYNIAIGMDFNLRGTRNGRVQYDNSGVGNVFYQILESDFMEATAYTPLTVGPDCIVDWAIAEFSLCCNPLVGNTSGHLTSVPILR